MFVLKLKWISGQIDFDLIDSFIPLSRLYYQCLYTRKKQIEQVLDDIKIWINFKLQHMQCTIDCFAQHQKDARIYSCILK